MRDYLEGSYSDGTLTVGVDEIQSFTQKELEDAHKKRLQELEKVLGEHEVKASLPTALKPPPHYKPGGIVLPRGYSVETGEIKLPRLCGAKFTPQPGLVGVCTWIIDHDPPH